ncbi:hypothetical protein QR680_007966 [Steinernema hermaphroditum]|uniref:Uncharacterized protein n=1 Tax=Steinernema hermaphroditum TaxID=289476 RepID=A0AA39M663_9BILA|nr:hypothetical protein QR680_007966 [Steinernema hermaphroditum]
MCCGVTKTSSLIFLALSWLWLLLEIAVRLLMVFLPPSSMKTFSIIVAIAGGIFTIIAIVSHITLTISVARESGHIAVAVYLIYTILAAIANTVAIIIFIIDIGIYGLVFFIVLALQIVTVTYFFGYIRYAMSH